MYFILRYTPNLDVILAEIVDYMKKGYFMGISKNIKRYFERKNRMSLYLIISLN